MPIQHDSQRMCTQCACTFIETIETGEVCFACKQPAPTPEESKAFFSGRPRTSGLLHEEKKAKWAAASKP